MNRDKWTESPPVHFAVPLRNRSFYTDFNTNLHRLNPPVWEQEPEKRVRSTAAYTAGGHGCQIEHFTPWLPDWAFYPLVDRLVLSIRK